MENVATYSEARSEYTKQLATFIVPALVSWFQKLWSRNAGDKGRCFVLFQGECEEVARWNQDRIHDEVRALIEKTGCDYMEELMTAVFIAHTKVLTAVRLSKREKKLNITIPKLDHFVHRVFREASRNYWKSPFLFSADGTVVDRQKNVLQIEALANEAIVAAVRSLLPVKQILKDYLEDDGEEIEDEAPAVVATVVAEEPAAAVESEVVEPAPAPPQAPDASGSEAAAPAVVKIDTEPTVSFADHNQVFTPSGSYMEHMVAEDDTVEDDISDGPADGVLKIEGEETPVGAGDVEDLEPAAAPAKPPVPKSIDDEVVILD
jgi:hypothetical protein